MTQLNSLIEQSRKGNCKAIATLLSRYLEPKHIKVTVNQKPRLLNILFESENNLPQSQLVHWITKVFNDLNLQGFEFIHLYARKKGENEFLWKKQIQIKNQSKAVANSQDFNINSSLEKPNRKSQSSSQTSNTVFQNSASLQTKTRSKNQRTRNSKLDIIREITESNTLTRILMVLAVIAAYWILTNDGVTGLIICITFGSITAYLAHQESKKFVDWWIYGFILSVIALIHILIIRLKRKVKEDENLAAKHGHDLEAANSLLIVSVSFVIGLIYFALSADANGGDEGSGLGMLIFLGLLAIIPANIARNKGYTPWRWWCYGLIFIPLAWFHANALKPNPNPRRIKVSNNLTISSSQGQNSEPAMKKCPYCAESIRSEAKLCRYCHSDLTKETVIESEAHTNSSVDIGTVAGVAAGAVGAIMVAENIADAMAVAEAHEALSTAMDLADAATSALETADSVAEIADALEGISDAAEAMLDAGEAASEAADALSSFGDFLDLFG